MKQVFYSNNKWNQAQIFVTANVSLAFVLLFILGFLLNGARLYLFIFKL
jgi:hypothetical protein